MKKILITIVLLLNFSNPASAGGGASLEFFLENDFNTSNNSNLNSSNLKSNNLNSNNLNSSNLNSSPSSDRDSTRNDDAIIIDHKKASCARNVKRPMYSRLTSPEYFSNYSGRIINAESLIGFFNITNNQYSLICDDWYRSYFNSQFNKALVFAYDPKNIKNITSYWGFSHNRSLNKISIERSALKKCNESNEKKESHKCAILFSNNEIVNSEYLSLAKQLIR